MIRKYIPAYPSLILLLTLSCFLMPALAQNRSSAQSATERPAQRSNQGARRTRHTQRAEEERRDTLTVVIPDLVTGQKVIEATAEFNTPLKLGLAPNSVTVVEFPARDSILRVHPGNQNFVTVDDTDTKPNFPLVFRPGDAFVVNPHGTSPAAIITVQMGSGMVFVFHIYPVASVTQSATHVFIRYDRDTVVAARRAAGLPVNYKPVPLRPGVYAPEEDAATTSAATALPASERANVPSVSTPVLAPPQLSPPPAPSISAQHLTSTATPTPARPAPAINSVLTSSSAEHIENPRPQPVSSPATNSTRPVAINSERAPDEAHVSAPGVGRVVPASTLTSGIPHAQPESELSSALRDYMKRVVADNRSFSRFTKPLYGLSVAVSRPEDRNLETRIIVVAVRNTLTSPVRLVQGQPDLFIETLDEHSRPVLVEPIQKLGMETTAPQGDVLAPGATAYYAVAFTPPVMGTHQYLRVSVAQTTAADAPASVDLTITSR